MILTDKLLDFYNETRQHTENICAPLEIEDYVVQPIVDVSPPKWHLGHTTWFFEEFILKPYSSEYQIFDDRFSFVFNSYYETIGKRVVRTDRGNMSRPSVKLVYRYRKYVDDAMANLFIDGQPKEVHDLLEIGIHHEKQHQELLLTDIKYILGNNPLLPAYSDTFSEHIEERHQQEWIGMDKGMYQIGHDSDSFCYDNEKGVHQVYLNAYKISNKLVTNGEYLEFIKHEGYKSHQYWHAEAWDWVNQNQIKAPMYWHYTNGEWQHYTASGLQKLEAELPVAHLSYYEAFAFAEWKGFRLPTEFEWEAAQAHFPWGTRWEWTESAYLPYPDYNKPKGALGEYNGKFMVNQKVLRGASVATSKRHSRHTYRNFFHPQLRWQFTGLRLAK